MPDTTGCDRPKQSGFAAPVSRPSGSLRESSRGPPHDPVDRSNLATTDQRVVGLWRATRWVRRQVNRASRRQQRAHRRPEPPSAPPAPASGAEPDPGTCVQVPDEWRRPESPLAPVQSQRSGCAAASAARRRRAHRHRRGPQDRRAVGGTGATGPPVRPPPVPGRRATGLQSGDREASGSHPSAAAA